MSSLERLESKTVFRNPKSQAIDARPSRSARAATRSSRRRRGSGGRRSNRRDITRAHAMPRNRPLPTKTREVARGRTSCCGRREEQEEAGEGGATGGQSPRQRRMVGPARGGVSGSPRGAYGCARSPSPAGAGGGGGEQAGGVQRPFDLFKKDRANFRDFLLYFPRFFA